MTPFPKRNFTRRWRAARVHKASLFVAAMLLLAACAAGQSVPAERSKDPQAALNKTWQWESTIMPVEKITTADPERYTIRLAPDGKAEVQFDCNRGGGNFKISEGKLSLGPLMSTRMACPPDSLDVLFMRDLQRVETFFTENGNLYLGLPYDGGTMRFRPAP